MKTSYFWRQRMKRDDSIYGENIGDIETNQTTVEMKMWCQRAKDNWFSYVESCCCSDVN